MTAAGARVRVTREAGVAVATLSHLRRRNAITGDMWRALTAFAQEAGDDPDVRALLIRGEGGSFSAGADITGFDTARADGAAANSHDAFIEAACVAIETVKKPVVAQLEGIVAGAGLELALACDLRVAAASARLVLPAARLGLGFDPRGIARLSRTLGPTIARAFLLTGAPITGERAYGLGIVTHMAPAGDVAAETDTLLRQLCANAPLTLAAAKASLLAAQTATPAALDEARALTDAANASADYREGRAAFAQKRSPNFTGR